MSKKPNVVSNASPLIYLAKVGQLQLLRDNYGEILIPKEVLQETGRSKGSPDAILIASAVDDGWVHIEDSEPPKGYRLSESAGIQIGEAAAILLAREKTALLLIDDKMGRSAAEILGVPCLGTIGALLEGLYNSTLDYDEFVALLDRMIDSGFRLDSKVYRRAMNMAKSLGKK
ncbi:MAG: DUF3368 domain-containing protein [Candidatus Thorarchaeota archaeon]|nr:DUF3368 domain-containing protein [Candidatus Thorarchaeota archaeon]